MNSFASGAAATVLVSVLLSLWADRSVFDTFTGCVLALLVSPAFWVGRVLAWWGMVEVLSPAALERFAGAMKDSKGWSVSYGRHGLVWVRRG